MKKYTFTIGLFDKDTEQMEMTPALCKAPDESLRIATKRASGRVGLLSKIKNKGDF